MLPRLFLAVWAVLAQAPSAELREIADPDNPDLSTEATAVSADGKVVVGDASSGFSRAFRWTEAEGFQYSGGLRDDGISHALDVSGDGEVVVGRAATIGRYES